MAVACLEESPVCTQRHLGSTTTASREFAGIGTAPEAAEPVESEVLMAQDLPEVIRAWRLVYEVYHQGNYIPANPYRLHTTQPACGERTGVFYATAGDQLECTCSAIMDGPHGLPLDEVYHDELDALRQSGRRLMECGLFAHARQITGDAAWGGRINPSGGAAENPAVGKHIAKGLISLMRLAFFYGVHSNVSDFLVGVHPHHARFYQRAFGFKQVGALKSYSTVNDRAVVLLHGDLLASVNLRPLPWALEAFLRNPVPDQLFDRRFNFRPARIFGGPNDLAGFLMLRYPEFAAQHQVLRIAG